MSDALRLYWTDLVGLFPYMGFTQIFKDGVRQALWTDGPRWPFFFLAASVLGLLYACYLCFRTPMARYRRQKDKLTFMPSATPWARFVFRHRQEIQRWKDEPALAPSVEIPLLRSWKHDAIFLSGIALLFTVLALGTLVHFSPRRYSMDHEQATLEQTFILLSLLASLTLSVWAAWRLYCVLHAQQKLLAFSSSHWLWRLSLASGIFHAWRWVKRLRPSWELRRVPRYVCVSILVSLWVHLLILTTALATALNCDSASMATSGQVVVSSEFGPYEGFIVVECPRRCVFVDLYCLNHHRPIVTSGAYGLVARQIWLNLENRRALNAGWNAEKALGEVALCQKELENLQAQPATDGTVLKQELQQEEAAGLVSVRLNPNSWISLSLNSGLLGLNFRKDEPTRFLRRGHCIWTLINDKWVFLLDLDRRVRIGTFAYPIAQTQINPHLLWYCFLFTWLGTLALLAPFFFLRPRPALVRFSRTSLRPVEAREGLL